MSSLPEPQPSGKVPVETLHLLHRLDQELERVNADWKLGQHYALEFVRLGHADYVRMIADLGTRDGGAADRMIVQTINRMIEKGAEEPHFSVNGVMCDGFAEVAMLTRHLSKK